MRRGRSVGRPGFVTTVAVMMIALVGVALAGLTAHLSTVARQAMQARERAQAEELVLAAVEVLRADPAATGVELPAALKELGASVKVAAREGARREIEVVVGRTRVAQVVEAKDGAVTFPPVGR